MHRDEHWLVRDLKLQPEGARQAADGTRTLRRFTKRRRDGASDDGDAAWEVVDHTTRQVRPCEPPDSDEDTE